MGESLDSSDDQSYLGGDLEAFNEMLQLQPQRLKRYLQGCLDEAVRRGSKRMMQILFDAVERLPHGKVRTPYYRSALDFAVSGRHADLAKLTLERSTLPALEDIFSTRFHRCKGEPETFAHMLDAVEQIRDEKKVKCIFSCALRWASSLEGTEMSAVLFNRYQSPVDFPAGILGAAMDAGCTENMSHLLDMVDETSEDPPSLHTAAFKMATEKCQTEVMIILLDRGWKYMNYTFWQVANRASWAMNKAVLNALLDSIDGSLRGRSLVRAYKKALYAKQSSARPLPERSDEEIRALLRERWPEGEECFDRLLSVVQGWDRREGGGKEEGNCEQAF